MRKSTEYERLDVLVDEVLKQGDDLSIMIPFGSEAAGKKLGVLGAVAFGLRGLPRAGFKEHLRAELERRKTMSSAARPAAEIRATASPRLTFKDAAKAIEFYIRAFGARETFRFEVGGGVAHAAIAIGDSSLFLAEEWPEGG